MKWSQSVRSSRATLANVARLLPFVFLSAAGCLYEPTGMASATDGSTTPAGSTTGPTTEESTSATPTSTAGETTDNTAGTSDGDGEFVVRGALGTLGVRPAGAGGFRVVDDGLEIGGLACGGQYCVRGGVRP